MSRLGVDSSVDWVADLGRTVSRCVHLFLGVVVFLVCAMRHQVLLCSLVILYKSVLVSFARTAKALFLLCQRLRFWFSLVRE